MHPSIDDALAVWMIKRIISGQISFLVVQQWEQQTGLQKEIWQFVCGQGVLELGKRQQ